jgi:anti-anti-sigma regulatory factor
MKLNLLSLNDGCPFLADGDKANRLFWTVIKPAVEADPTLEVKIDCEGVENLNDSFANALFGPCFEWHLKGFKIKIVNASPLVKSFVQSAMEIHARRGLG